MAFANALELSGGSAIQSVPIAFIRIFQKQYLLMNLSQTVHLKTKWNFWMLSWMVLNLWNMLQAVFTGIGGWLGYFLGGCDGLLYALIAFTVIDYISGVMCGIVDGKLSSSIGFKGICRKVVVFMLVGIASILDTRIFQTGSVLRTAVIFFYLSNEGISLLENAAHLGLPIPTVVRKALNQLHDKSENKENENGK